MRDSSRRWLLAFAAIVIGLLAFVASVRGPYFWPVSVAPGPCLADWTTPLSYPLLTGERASPLESSRLELASGSVIVCYGRPAARGRTLFGTENALVPYGRLWRTGANEPTRLFTDLPLDVGGIRVPPGRYSLYTMPYEERWVVALNGSTFHWGNDLSDRVRAQEIGRTVAAVDSTRAFTEQFTIELEKAPADSARLVISWGHVRVAVPIAVQSAVRPAERESG